MLSQEITLNGREYRLDISQDDIGAPWDNCDGHGIVSDWTARSKAPGEMVLSEDHGLKRFYDFAESCKIALRDGWNMAKTRKDAAKAALQDFENLKAFCDDVWTYSVVTLTEIRTDNDGFEYDGFCDSMCGVEYWPVYNLEDKQNEHIMSEIVAHLESEILAQHKIAA